MMDSKTLILEMKKKIGGMVSECQFLISKIIEIATFGPG